MCWCVEDQEREREETPNEVDDEKAQRNAQRQRSAQSTHASTESATSKKVPCCQLYKEDPCVIPESEKSERLNPWSLKKNEGGGAPSYYSKRQLSCTSTSLRGCATEETGTTTRGSSRPPPAWTRVDGGVRSGGLL
ncbi:hypothetical protein SEVIR_9G458650v4 [Setaria viridis]